MKIAFITDYNKYTGIGAQNYNLFSSLKDQGLDIDIINLVSPQGYKDIPNYGINIISNIKNHRYLSFGYGVFFKYLNGLKEILSKGNYTHIILGHQGLAYLGTKLQKNYKTIIIVHDLFTLYEDKKKGKDELIYNNFLLKGINKIRNIVFISEFTKKDYEKYFGSLDNQNYKVIYQGIDKKDVDLKIKKQLIDKYNLNNKKIILNVGSEDGRKNIKTYLDVVEHFKDKKDIQFVRIGRKSSESEKYITDNNLKNILYCSGISDEELIAWYDIATIILSTSTLEGYGRQIFEGYLYNTNIVTSNVSDVEKIFNGDPSVHIVKSPMEKLEYIKGIDFVTKNIGKKSEIQNSKGECMDYKKFLENL